MTQDSAPAASASRARRWVAGGLVALAALAISLAAWWLRPAVRWPEVLAAVGRQETVRGLARIYLPDGSEWEYALWARISGPGRTVTNAMTRPVRLSAGQARPPEKLPKELTALGQAMDVCGREGVITRLAATGPRWALARRTEWGGRQVVLVEVSGQPGRAATGGPDRWRFFVDPGSKLVLGAEMFTLEAGRPVLRGRCSFDYNLALPRGFRQE